MRKILIMISAGEIYDHDCVRWYRAHDIQRWIEHYHNIGDAFVLDSSLKLLDFDIVKAIDIRKMDEDQIKNFNEEYDYCFLRGSNYIQDGINWHHMSEILEKLTIPVIAFGIGAQASSTTEISVSSETRRVMKLISERCCSVGVRGTFSAEVLTDLGVHNVRVIGCPTLFRHKRPELEIPTFDLKAIRKLGYTLRREVSNTYASDIATYLSLQRETILDVAAKYDLTLISQGEIAEKKIALGTQEQKRDAMASLRDSGWMGGDNRMIKLSDIYDRRLFYSDVVADYDQLVRDMDLVLGFRLHGNLIALSNGVPSIYFTYDSRTREFADFLKIPTFNVFSSQKFEIEAYDDPALFEPFNRAYVSGYDNMRAFLNENGIAHRMDAMASKENVENAAV